MTRLWPLGRPISVQADPLAVPLTFIWQGRIHRVCSVAKRWRVDQAWWQQRIWREYFKLSTDSGLLVIIYRDLLTGDWYLQRLYD